MDFGRATRGMVFGTDGLLYVTATNDIGNYEIFGYDGLGQEIANYSDNMPVVGNNVFYGNLAADGTNIYVGGSDGITKYEIGGNGVGTRIFGAQGQDAFDLEVLPNGNLLVASSHNITEITNSGATVREFNVDGFSFSSVRGVEFDPVNEKIYVTQLSGDLLLRIDYETEVIDAQSTYWYGCDMHFSDAGELIVGSWTQAPGLFDRDLNFQGNFGAFDMFVTQSSIPEPASLPILLLAAVLIVVAARRRGEGRPS